MEKTETNCLQFRDPMATPPITVMLLDEDTAQRIYAINIQSLGSSGELNTVIREIQGSYSLLQVGVVDDVVLAHKVIEMVDGDRWLETKEKMKVNEVRLVYTRPTFGIQLSIRGF